MNTYENHYIWNNITYEKLLYMANHYTWKNIVYDKSLYMKNDYILHFKNNRIFKNKIKPSYIINVKNILLQINNHFSKINFPFL